MADRYRPITYRPADGGALIPAVAPSEAGLANYTAKVNLRRDGAAEIRREGWSLFAPVTPIPGPQPLNAGSPPTMIAQFARPNGRSAVVAAAGNQLHRLVPEEDSGYVAPGYVAPGYVAGDQETHWRVIAGGLQTAGARRWQVESVNGYLILNNAVDLPQIYREEWGATRPHYELREQGIASVGEIVRFGEYLFFMDLTEIPQALLSRWFENAVDPYGLCDAAAADAAGVYLERTHYAVAWSHPAEPTRLGVVVPGTNLANSRIFQLEYPARSLQPNQEVVVVGGGVDGGSLTTRIAQIASDGRTVTLVAELPSVGTGLLRADMVGTPAGRKDLTDSSARILKAREFRGRCVILTDGGYFTVVPTGDAEDPFQFEKFYDDTDESGQRRGRVPHFPNSLIKVDDRLIFIGFTGPWQIDLRTAEPQPVPALWHGPQFWADLLQTQEQDLWAVDNPVTKEVWWCTPTATVALDYLRNTVSTIDTVFTCAGAMRRPGILFQQSADLWFVLGMADGKLRRYGLGQAYRSLHRDGGSYTSRLRSGYSAFGNEFDEKTVEGWMAGFHAELLTVPVPVAQSVVAGDGVWSLAASNLAPGMYYVVTARLTRTPEGGGPALTFTLQVQGTFTAEKPAEALKGELSMQPQSGYTDAWDQFVITAGGPAGGPVAPNQSIVADLFKAHMPEGVATDIVQGQSLADGLIPTGNSVIKLFDAATYFGDEVRFAGVHANFRLHHRTWSVMGARTKGATQERESS